ncbi:cell division protein SepF [Leptolyngbya ohadii]|uniref:cell division protein SepF n=1 Tax=Leptolyngbya ohadii TaxID=1962290 RepID=UPI000B59D10E|nr:cell division protein SepF [Leptolyngbya ohadii]
MNLFQRLRDAIGFGEGYDEYDEYDEEGEVLEGESLEGDRTPIQRSGKVVGMPGVLMEVTLMQPRSFEEASQAVMALRERKSVVLNLASLDPVQAQRCADYVAGGAFAIDGHQQQLSTHVFLFTPSFVQITQSGIEATVKQIAQAQQNPWASPQQRPS